MVAKKKGAGAGSNLSSLAATTPEFGVRPPTLYDPSFILFMLGEKMHTHTVTSVFMCLWGLDAVENLFLH